MLLLQKMHLLMGTLCVLGPAIRLILISPDPFPLFSNMFEDTTPPRVTAIIMGRALS